jgi:hypothetical protein
MNFAQTRNSHAFLIRQKVAFRILIVKFCLETPNKSKSKTVEAFRLLGFKIPTINRTINKSLRSKKKWREELVPRKNVPFRRLKCVLP